MKIISMGSNVAKLGRHRKDDRAHVNLNGHSKKSILKTSIFKGCWQHSALTGIIDNFETMASHIMTYGKITSSHTLNFNDYPKCMFCTFF